MPKNLTRREFAKKHKVTETSVRYWQRLGIIPPGEFITEDIPRPEKHPGKTLTGERWDSPAARRGDPQPQERLTPRSVRSAPPGTLALILDELRRDPQPWGRVGRVMKATGFSRALVARLANYYGIKHV